MKQCFIFLSIFAFSLKLQIGIFQNAPKHVFRNNFSNFCKKYKSHTLIAYGENVKKQSFFSSDKVYKLEEPTTFEKKCKKIYIFLSLLLFFFFFWCFL